MSEKWLFVVLFGSITMYSLFVNDRPVSDIASIDDAQTLSEQIPLLRFSPITVEPLAKTNRSLSFTNDEQVDSAWRAAQIYLRLNGELFYSRAGDDKSRARIETLLQKRTMPTIVFLPGCTLPRWPGPSHFWRQLTRSGFAVIGIDGFARSDWQDLCVDDSLMVGAITQQVQFVLRELNRIPWVDRNNLFLMGFGEGGAGVSAYLGNGFNGIIVLAASCRAHVLQPVAPVLAIASERDSALGGTKDYCHYASERLLIDSVVHGVLVFDDAQKAVHRFLQRYLI